MRHHKELILAVWCFLATMPSSGQSLRVRIVSTDTGNALSGKRVDIERANVLLVHPGLPEISKSHNRLRLKTNHDGWTTVGLNQLGNRFPVGLLISVAIGNWTQCSPLYFSVESILQSGLVAENHCKSKATDGHTYLAGPGEILVFTRHISFGEKLRHFRQ